MTKKTKSESILHGLFMICVLFVGLLGGILISNFIHHYNNGYYDENSNLENKIIFETGNMTLSKFLTNINDELNCSGLLFERWDKSEWFCYTHIKTEKGTIIKEIIIT